MTDGRANQKTRTRTALLHAAMELVREGRPPSIPEAADRALISVATAYRYFPSAEELWFEASAAALEFEPALVEANERIAAAGDDPVARLEAWVRSAGFTMIDNQAPFRRVAKGALEQWFSQVDTPVEQRVPMRQGRRNDFIAVVVEPLRGQLTDDDVDRIAHALGVVDRHRRHARPHRRRRPRRRRRQTGDARRRPLAPHRRPRRTRPGGPPTPPTAQRPDVTAAPHPSKPDRRYRSRRSHRRPRSARRPSLTSDVAVPDTRASGNASPAVARVIEVRVSAMDTKRQP